MEAEEHQCIYREENEELRNRVTQLEGIAAAFRHEFETLKRQIFGRKSEKLPSVKHELKRSGTPESPKNNGIKTTAESRQDLETKTIVHLVSAEKRNCPRCGSDDHLRPLGEGKKSTIYEYVPAKFVKEIHIQEVLSCRCGEHIVTADGPIKAVQNGHYGPGFMAHLAVAKCCDSIPLYRLEKEYTRIGIPIRRSTMTDLFHQAANGLIPIAKRLLAIIGKQDIVQADETPIKIMAKKKCRRGYIWTFRSDNLIGYRFSPSRSGATPSDVLSGTKGTLVVDAYTGYNAVTDIDGRVRSGCFAHVRRKFFDAISTAPIAQQALDLILDLYRVEHEAKEKQIVRTPAHHELRQQKSRPTMQRLLTWLEEQQTLHPPKSPIAQATQYTFNNWIPLGRFLEDVRIPLDNNASESALRVIALGRKNFLFVGNDQAGENIATLYSIVATCEANHVNPTEYIKDILIRIQFHPASRIDELLPQNWTR